MYVFAIDPSLSNTGVVIFDVNGRVVRILSICTSSKKTHGVRLGEIYDSLVALRNHYPCDILICENGFTRYNKATQALYKVRGIIELIFCDCECIFLAPKEIKKFVGGDGRMKKDDLRKVILNKYEDIKFEDTDQSDAFAIGLTWFLKNNIIH